MASSVFDLFARLLLDTGEFEKGLNGAKGIASGAGSKIGSAISTSVKVAGAALAATSTAVTAFGKSALDASIDYESAFTGVTKTVEETTTTSYEMLSDAIKQMATETASSKEVIAGVMEAAGQLGVSADDIVGFTKTMIELGDTTNLSADEAAIALAHFTNITRTSNGDVDKLGAAIVDLGNNFATDEASIVSMSTRLAAAGTIAGLSAPDILALSTAMSSVGINAEAGGTAMSTVLTKISNAVDSGGEKLTAFAEVAGMTAEEFTAAWKSDPVQALSSFIVGLNGTMEAGGNVSAVLEDLNIKGIRETNMVKSLALAHDVLSNAVETSNTAFNENTALIAEAEKRYGTTESQLSQLKEGFSNLKVEIGDSLKPTLAEFIEYAKTSVISLGEAFREDGLQGALRALEPAIDQGIELIFNKLPTVLNAGASLLDTFVTGVITNLPKLIPAALQIIDQITTSISENAGKLIDSSLQVIVALGDGIIQALPQLVPVAVQLIEQIVQSISENAEKMVDGAVQVILALADGLIQALPELLPAITEIIVAIITKLSDPETASRLWEASRAIMVAIGEGLIKSVGIILSKIPQIVKNLADRFIKEGPQMLNPGAALTESLLKGIIKPLPELYDKAVEIAKETAEKIKAYWRLAKEIGGALIDVIKQGIQERVEEVIQAGREVVENVKQGFLDAVSAAREWGSDLISNFIDGILAKAQDLWSTVTDIAQSVVDLIGFSEPKKGPLSNFHTYAPDMMKLYAKGIKDNEGLLTAQIEKSFNFEPQLRGAAPVLAAGPTTNTYNITVNGIEELDEVLRWYQGRQVEARMV